METKQDTESVNTEVVAVPFADLLVTESSTGAKHLVNAIDAYEARNTAYIRNEETVDVTTMCGKVTVEIPVTGDIEEVDSLTHLTDVVSPEMLNDNGVLMNHPWKVLDNLCGSCEASWKRAFENGNYQTVRYEMTD